MSVYLFHVVLYFSCKNLLLPKKTAFLYWARCASTSTENSVFLRCCSSLMRAKQRACCCSRFSITLFTFVQNYSAQALPINDIYALTGRWLQFSGERNKERKKKNHKKTPTCLKSYKNLLYITTLQNIFISKWILILLFQGCNLFSYCCYFRIPQKGLYLLETAKYHFPLHFSPMLSDQVSNKEVNLL